MNRSTKIIINRFFVDAGIYTSEVEALADYFKRADAVRPDVTLSINEYRCY